MKLIPIALVIIMSFCGLALPLSAPAADSIRWHTYDEGLAAGKQKQKQILVHFYATWCHFCKKMAQETLGNADVVSYVNKHFVPVRVDIDRERKIPSQYGVRGVPSTWFLTESGKKIDVLPGFVSQKQFLSILEKVTSSTHKKTP